MTGRESVFSDPRVIAIINEHFVPVADNCSPLQTQPGEAGEFFRLIAEQGHYAGRTQPTSTRQGLYVATPDGELLASVNSTNADRVLHMIQRAITAWKSHPSNQGAPAEAATAPTSRPPAYPEGGLVLKMYARDLPRGEAGTDSPLNFDYVWFTREEVNQFIPDGVNAGDRFPVPEIIVTRLARHHLVDTVRGECPSWRHRHIQSSGIDLVVESVENSLVKLRLEGRVRLVAPPSHEVNPFSKRVVDQERGIDARLLGFLTYNRERQAFEEFKMIAAGPRWGAHVYNGRSNDPGPAPIGFAFEIAGDSVKDRTPPMAFRSGYFSR